MEDQEKTWVENVDTYMEELKIDKRINEEEVQPYRKTGYEYILYYNDRVPYPPVVYFRCPLGYEGKHRKMNVIKIQK